MKNKNFSLLLTLPFIGFEISKFFVFIFQKLTVKNFIFKLKLFIDHLNVSYDLKISDLDLDVQGQIGLQTFKIFILIVKH